MLPDPIGREDDGTAEGTVAGLNRPLAIHSGRGQTKLKSLSTLCMAVHVVCGREFNVIQWPAWLNRISNICKENSQYGLE